MLVKKLFAMMMILVLVGTAVALPPVSTVLQRPYIDAQTPYDPWPVTFTHKINNENITLLPFANTEGNIAAIWVTGGLEWLPPTGNYANSGTIYYRMWWMNSRTGMPEPGDLGGGMTGSTAVNYGDTTFTTPAWPMKWTNSNGDTMTPHSFTVKQYQYNVSTYEYDEIGSRTMMYEWYY